MGISRWIVATGQRRVGLGVLVVLTIPLLAVACMSVDEEFPLTTSAEIPPNMTQAEVEAVMGGMAKVDSEMTEAMPASTEPAEQVSVGSFRDADSFHRGAGRAAIYTLSSGETLLRLEEFMVTNGPGLHVLLSRHSNPGSRSEVKDQGYLDLGRLKANIGDQNYEIPSGTDLSAYGSVVIYCMPFHVIFSVASLSSS